ncbi:hypothetical protein KI387_014569, partial [Taxus chinensis]
ICIFIFVCKDKRLSGTMELMSEGGLKERIIKDGKKLKHLHHSKDALLKDLEETANCLVMVEQSDKYMIHSLMFQLIKPRIFWHEDVRVKNMVVTCIVEVTRVTAPNLPYSDDIMRDIFEHTVESFQGFWNTTIRYHNKRMKILETMTEEELRQEVSCNSHTLAKGVMNQIKMKTYMASKSSEKDMGMDPQGMSSSVHTKDFLVSNTCIKCEGIEKSAAKVKKNQESVKQVSKGYPPTNENANGKIADPYSTDVHMQ